MGTSRIRHRKEYDEPLPSSHITGDMDRESTRLESTEFVSLPADLLHRYRRFSLYNSPYPAHDTGRAIDLYPSSNEARSPIAGEVVETKTVRCPDRPYAVDHDHLLVIRVTTFPSDASDMYARILHVDADVRPGDHLDVGDRIGTLVRSGFFGPWVDNHLHLGFRPRDRNPFRARGSIPIMPDTHVTGVTWDGSGIVVDTGDTYAILDAPRHPAPDEKFIAIADANGRPLDGGLTHYAGGGYLDHSIGFDAHSIGSNGAANGRDSRTASLEEGQSAVELLGTTVGTATGRTIAWNDVEVVANGSRITGLSLFAARDGDYGAKLITRDRSFDVGEAVSVTIRSTETPIRLGPGR